MLQSIKNLIPENLKKQIKLIVHKGDKYVCPFCGYASRDLALIGNEFPVLEEKKVIGGGRRYAGCFKCASTDRERLVFAYLRDKLNLFTDCTHYKILDIAPDLNFTEKMFQAGFAEYVCGDLFTEGYDYPDYVQNMDVQDIPYPENYFDLVICNHVFEHIIDDTKAMREVYRVLKKGKHAILMVPFSSNMEKTYEDDSITSKAEREKHFGQRDHVRLYGLDYFSRLESAGFEVKRLNISHEYPELGLNSEEELITGHKDL